MWGRVWHQGTHFLVQVSSLFCTFGADSVCINLYSDKIEPYISYYSQPIWFSMVFQTKKKSMEKLQYIFVSVFSILFIRYCYAMISASVYGFPAISRSNALNSFTPFLLHVSV